MADGQEIIAKLERLATASLVVEGPTQQGHDWTITFRAGGPSAPYARGPGVEAREHVEKFTRPTQGAKV